jgi:hypothetical protein
MRNSKQSNPAALPPDQIKLNGIQAQRFASLTNIDIKQIEGQDLATLAESLKWQVDPDWFLFRRICGQVVRWDPKSGQYLPVPFATVHVMDTVCDFIGFFPEEVIWAWLFPIFCRQEQITQVVTDECGNFCVWIPWFDIEWVIRWRLQLICFPEIFVQTNLGKLLQSVGVLPKSGPGPDPGPIDFRNAGLTLDRLAAIVGRPTASRLLLASQSAGAVKNTSALSGLLNQPAFLQPVPPPKSASLTALQKQYQDGGAAKLKALVRGKADKDYQLNLNNFVGPFPRFRCEWVVEEEIVPLLEIPDITFWVTQDVNGDGEQETIYSQGYFGVGWQSGSISDVTIYASSIARVNTTGTCITPPVDDCKDTPQILFAGLMPVNEPGYIDTSAFPSPTRGFGLRPNPPHTDALIRSSVFPPSSCLDTPSNAPFTGTIQLYGCNQYPNGDYYRLLYSYNGAPATPFTNLDWYLDPFPGPGAPLHVVPDAQGWYPILAAADAWFPPDELLDWPTTSYPDGLYDVTMEIGDASKAVIYTTPISVPFYVDNSAPAPSFLSLAWRVAGTSAWNYFADLVCPIVTRTPGDNLEFRVSYQVSMPHLLKLTLNASGCGGGVTIQTEPAPNWSDPPTASFDTSGITVCNPTGVSLDPYDHWYEDPSDNFVSRAAIFYLPAAALAGCYGFSLTSYSRAFNPSGGDASNPQANEWYVNMTSLNWNQANLSVAIIDA